METKMKPSYDPEPYSRRPEHPTPKVGEWWWINFASNVQKCYIIGKAIGGEAYVVRIYHSDFKEPFVYRKPLFDFLCLCNEIPQSPPKKRRWYFLFLA